MSVILPTYNRLPLLLEAVASVRRQTFVDWELIVVDDGSTDRTVSALHELHEPRLRVITVRHSGVPAVVRNAGLEVASGRYVAFLDSDDGWLPGKIEQQLALLLKGVRWCYTGFSLVDSSATTLYECESGWLKDGWILLDLLRGQAVPNSSTVVAERSLIAEVGGFDAALLRGEDLDLWLRLARAAPVGCVALSLAVVRDHAERLTRDSGPQLDATIAVYQKALQAARDPAERDICHHRLAHLHCAVAAARARKKQWWPAARSLYIAVRFSPAAVATHAWRSARRRLQMKPTP